MIKEITTDEYEEVSFASHFSSPSNSVVLKDKKGKQKIRELSIFPLQKRPFFPEMAAPIIIEPGPYLDTIKKIAKSEDKYVALVLTKKEDKDIYQLSFRDLFKVGILARVLRMIPTEQGGVQVIFNMEKRLHLVKRTKEKLPLTAKVMLHEDEAELTDELKAYSISVISTIKELLRLNPLYKEELQIFLSHSDFTSPGRLADFSVALTTASREELQEILETFDVMKRIEKALGLLKKELDLSRIQKDINQKIESTISKCQKDFYLREQLKTIKKELGIEKEEKSIDKKKFQTRLKKKKVPKDVMEIIQEEMHKLSSTEQQSAEYAVTRNYLDWLTVLPWGVHCKENRDLAKAKKILEEDHHGLEDIKERILEFISVGILSGEMKGNIICLVGPPGVGKTSVGKSIARALNRPFYRFSVGGMKDEAEIKGHRRTYIGSMPGKMAQALKYCKVMNPVIMIDEVDKIGNSYQGDPASALLEVLDPEQNKEFLDHYLDVRCDLSNVLFLVTANVLDTIPGPLRDRMDVMRLSGYIIEEKLEIAKQFLIPKNRKKMGMKATDVSFEEHSIRKIIDGYAREAGVRSLEKNIAKVLRKVAMEIVEGRSKKKTAKSKKCVITKNGVEKYLKQPLFTSEKFYAKTPVGVSIGLAWTAMGGSILYIESTRVSAEKVEMKLTGQAGNVMKESSQIAWTYLHSAVEKYVPKSKFFPKNQVHMHIPEGATPKDGPSAGITMVTSLLSLLKNCSVRNDLGMTGEITLTGKVLPVGGIKEKIVAAKRSSLKEIILPKDNARDYQELPKYIKKDLIIHFVDNYDEVYRIIFGEGK